LVQIAVRWPNDFSPDWWTFRTMLSQSRSIDLLFSRGGSMFTLITLHKRRTI
jgi:hypothetical protein